MSMNHFRILSEKPAATIISASMIERRMDAGCFQPTYLKNESNLLNGRVPYARLGSLYNKGNYGSLPDSVDYATEGVALIRGTDLQSMAIDLSEAVRVPEYYYDQFKKAQVTPGDILMLVKGASIDRPDSVAMFPETDDKAIANGSVFIIRAKGKKINNKYLLAVMTSESFLLQKRRGSSNTGALYNDLDTIRSFIVPLPHPKIQQFISEKVALAEECRIEASKHKSLLFKKISEYIDEPSSSDTSEIGYWADESLTSERIDPMYYQPVYISNVDYLTNRSDSHYLSDNRMCSLVTDGDHGNPVYSEKGPAYLRVTDFQGFNIQHKNMPHINSEYAQKIGARCYVKNGDVIVSIVGTIGLITVINDRSEGAIASRGVARIVTSSSLNPFYLASYLASTRGQLQLKQLCVGTVQKGIYLDSLKRIQVPLLDKLIQDEIGNHLQKHISLIDISSSLSEGAKSDVEALIEGKLDTDAILSGKLKAPTWEDIEKELEGI